jgi:pantoate--beta-alanine ligase
VKDLDIPVHVIAGPTSREEDGLALSSRNAYLNHNERGIAGRLNEILREAIQALHNGAPIAEVEAKATQALLDAGFSSVDYVAVRCASDLSEIKDGPIAGRARILAAARLGKTRLIDNMAV